MPLCFLLLTGCAITYQDDNGNQRVIGLVSMTIDKPKDKKSIAGDKVTITSLGVMYSDTPIHKGLSIGYYSEMTYVLKNNVAIIVEKEN
jgi:hypothetical protein